MLLFVTANVAKVSLQELIKEVAPFIVAEIVALGILTYVPQSVLLLTNLMK
jgi:C4-dicarboxylate transporter, DctM subunit